MLLYKYTRAKHLKSIVRGILAFPRHSQLNDPFESSIECAIDHLRIDFKYEPPMRNLTPLQIAPNLLVTNGSSDVTSGRRLENEMLASQNQRLEATFKYLLFCRDHLGILALTADPENVVMWAHYAENSSGVCVGIEFDHIFFNDYKPTSWKEATHHRLFQPRCVAYERSRPAYGEATPLRYVEKAFFTKYEPWAYEQEYRLVRPIAECDTSGAVPLYQVPQTLIKEIILGMNAQPPVVQLASDLCQQFKNLRLWKIESIREQYELKRRPMN